MNTRKLTLLLMSVLTILAAAIVAPALPDINAEFSHIENSAFLSKLVLSLPAIFIAMTAPFAGRIIDKYGRLRLLFLALVLYAVAGTSGLYLENLYLILMGRAFLGVGIGMAMTVTITLIGDYFQRQERQDFMGQQAAFVGFSGVVFLAAGGFLAEINWRMPFAMYLFSILLIPMVIFNLQEPEREGTAAQVGKITFGGVLKVLFLHSMVMMILFYVTPTQLPFLLDEIGYASKTLSGMTLALNAAGMVLGSIMYSRVKNKMSFPTVFALGFFLMGIGYMITGSVTDKTIIIFSMITTGIGIGFLMPNTQLWALEITPDEFRGRTMGVLTMCLFTGQFLSPIAVEPILRNSNLASLFFLVGVIMVLIALLYATVGKRLAKK